MAHYNKGANAERELMHLLHDNGFAVVRAAGSGKNQLECPDVIALKANKIFIFECKAVNAEYLYIEKEKIAELEEFVRRAGSQLIIAWKIPHGGWLYFGVDKMKKTVKSLMIKKTDAIKHSTSLNVLSGLQKQITNLD